MACKHYHVNFASSKFFLLFSTTSEKENVMLYPNLWPEIVTEMAPAAKACLNSFACESKRQMKDEMLPIKDEQYLNLPRLEPFDYEICKTVLK